MAETIIVQPSQLPVLVEQMAAIAGMLPLVVAIAKIVGEKAVVPVMLAAASIDNPKH